jgi:hypothetical protein
MTMFRRALVVAAMLVMPMALLGGCADWPQHDTRQPASDSSMRSGKANSNWHVSDAGAAPAPQNDAGGTR